MTQDILVTGGAGFIGSHVVEFYARQGDDVTVLDNLSRVELLEKGDQRVWITEITRAKRELDWEPRVSFEEGVGRFLEWATENLQ